MDKALLDELSTNMVSSFNVKFSSSGILNIDGERITLTSFPEWFMRYCREEHTKKFMPLMLDSVNSSVFLETLKVSLKKSMSSGKKAAFREISDLVKPYDYCDAIPFINIVDHKMIMFYDKKQRKLLDLDYDTYKEITDKEYRIKPTPAYMSFNPYRPEQVYISEYAHKITTHINTYLKPEWQLDKALSDAEIGRYTKPPQIIAEFLQHLVPLEHCREFVYDWLHYALTERCETYLVLNGAKGIGKNILSDFICKTLLGSSNHKVAHQSALKGFNAILVDCRMIVFDEFKITEQEDINTLKRIINPIQMIEFKGVDATKNQETYNSFIICNNALTDIKLEWNERRFSVVDLTEVKLREVWTKQKIDEAIKIFSDPQSEEMINFGYWLMYRKPVVMQDRFTDYKGDHFYRICYASMAEWSKMLIDDITSGPSVGYYEESDLRIKFKDRTNGQQRFPNITKVIDFLKNYKHDGQHYLGIIEKDGDTNYLQINPYFLKRNVDGTNSIRNTVDLL
jgi:hypothetical protein